MGTPARGAGASRRRSAGVPREADDVRCAEPHPRRVSQHRDLLRADHGDPRRQPSRCPRAASSPCWAPTAPARPPSSRPISGVMDPQKGSVDVRGPRDPAAWTPTRSCGSASATCPRAARCSRFLIGAREPAHGRLHPPRRATASPATSRRCSATSRSCASAPTQRAGLAVGRRAADAGDQPRADGAAQADAARRAVARACRPSWSRRSSRSSCASTASAASPSCWSSRTPTWRCRPPTTATCWRTAAS